MLYRCESCSQNTTNGFRLCRQCAVDANEGIHPGISGPNPANAGLGSDLTPKTLSDLVLAVIGPAAHVQERMSTSTPHLFPSDIAALDKQLTDEIEHGDIPSIFWACTNATETIYENQAGYKAMGDPGSGSVNERSSGLYFSH